MIERGKKAPAFTLDSDAGKQVSLADFRGKPVVVYFYPRDNTPGCTREAIAFSESIGRLRALGADVVGISRDTVVSHCKFRDQFGLRFTLLSDPDLSVHKAYGAYGEKTMYGKKVLGTIRSTFIVDAKGTVAEVFPNVKVDGHVEQVIAALGGAAEPPASGKKAPPAKRAPAKKKPAAKAAKKR